MEMYQLQTVLHIFFLQEVQRFEQFTGCQSELAGISSAFFPFATSTGSQFNANTDIRFHLQLLRHLGNKIQLIKFLHNKKNAFAHFLCQQCQFNEALVLISVTNHEGTRVCIDPYHSMQLRL